MSEASQNEKIRTTLSIARAYGRARGLSEEQCEDLAQTYVIGKYVRGTRQSLAQAYVDFLRFELGDTRTPNGIAKSKALRTYESIDCGLDRRTETHGSNDRLGSRHDRREDYERRLRLVSLDDSYLLSLLSKGWTQEQIAEEFGVSGPRISQRVSEIKAKLEQVDLDRVLEVEWVTL